MDDLFNNLDRFLEKICKESGVDMEYLNHQLQDDIEMTMVKLSEFMTLLSQLQGNDEHETSDNDSNK
ncbi:hypothetical protein [Kistimonas asteriae]|uniref:hypothetical protein n=1 Tax=Kistimonas asteriae TaxID=517724 RepID=UPI001BA6929E|nr:hypothetical protein [Kistimonas asteriae]